MSDDDNDDEMMTVSRLEDDTEEITIREGESLALGCQVIAGIFKYIKVQITLNRTHTVEVIVLKNTKKFNLQYFTIIVNCENQMHFAKVIYKCTFN